jgi:hypothetical protein
VSATKVPTRTSIRSAAPCEGRSRRKTACANGIPIQSNPSRVTPTETVAPSWFRGRAAKAKISGKAAAST